MNASRIVQAIPSTEPCSFGEFLNDLGGDAPETGDSEAYRDLFKELKSLEDLGMVEIDRGYNNRINTMVLTEMGADYVRDLRRGGHQ